MRVGAWPVQFIPVLNALTDEAVAEADTADYEGTPLRVLGADYLAAIALDVGRARDFARILALLDAGSVTTDRMAELANRHGLTAALRFKARFLE